jgi:acetate kinase
VPLEADRRASSGSRTRPPYRAGRNSPEIRALALRGLGWLSVELDEPANAEVREDDRINAADSAIAVLVLRAREDIEIATQVRRLLAGSGG